MTSLSNNAISNSEFLENLKLGDATLVFKKKDHLDKTNYRPVSALPTASKVFERLIQKQINEHKKTNCLLSHVDTEFQYAVYFIVSYRTFEKNP